MHTFRATSRNLQAFRLCKKKFLSFMSQHFGPKAYAFILMIKGWHINYDLKIKQEHHEPEISGEEMKV